MRKVLVALVLSLTAACAPLSQPASPYPQQSMNGVF